jgi:PAS domain S-box-containing protein
MYIFAKVNEQYQSAGDEELPPTLALIPRLASSLAIAVGSLTLCGWLFDIERLRRPLAAFVAMNPATGLAFVVIGVALALSLENRPTGSRVTAKWLSGVVLLIGAAKLVGLAMDWHPNIDEFLFRSELLTPGQLPNRMAPNTAVNFLVLGLGLLAIELRLGGTSLGQMFAVIAAFGALLPLTGYLYGERSFQGLASFIPMAPHTAITFLFVSVGLFFSRSRLRLTQTFATRDPRGVLARRLLPSVVMLTLALGWLRLAGEQRGLYTAKFGTALFAVILSLLFVILIAWAVSAVARADQERNAANLALLESKVELEESLRQSQLIIEHAREIICTIDGDGKFVTVNSASEAILGRGARDLIGSSFCELHAVEDRPDVLSALRQATTGFQTANLAVRCLRKDKTVVTIAWSLQSSTHHPRIFGVGRASAGGAYAFETQR